MNVASIGIQAAEFLSSGRSWTCAARFERSVYLQSDEAFVCVGDASIGNGPINVLLADGGELSGCADACVQRPVGSVFTWDDDRLWRPPPWPSCKADALSGPRIDAIVTAALAIAPPDSVLAAFRTKSAAMQPLATRSRTGLLALGMAIATPSSRCCDTAAVALLGLGHGLTPGGDDALSGALVLLQALNHASGAEALACSVREHMRDRTSVLSCAFLDLACSGHKGAAVHDAISALLVGRPVDDVVDPLAGIGHSSGFDMLAGIITAVRMLPA